MTVSWENLFSEQPNIIIKRVREEQEKNPGKHLLAILRNVLTEFGVPEQEQSIYRADIGRLLLKDSR